MITAGIDVKANIIFTRISSVFLNRWTLSINIHLSFENLSEYRKHWLALGIALEIAYVSFSAVDSLGSEIIDGGIKASKFLALVRQRDFSFVGSSKRI